MVVQLVPTNVELPVTTQHAWYLRHAIDQSENVTEYRDYYAGKQPNALTDKQLEMLEGLISDTAASADEWDASSEPQGGSDFLCDNAVKIIIGTIGSRIRLKGFSCTDEDVSRAIQRDWFLNNLDAKQHDIHRHAFIDGVSYAMLNWDNDRRRVAITIEQEWTETATNVGEGVHVMYDAQRRPVVAIREWVDEFLQNGVVTRRRRRNLYFADRIERWVMPLMDGASQTSGMDWEPFVLPDDLSWPVSWVNPETGEPLGIPIVPFVNQPDHLGYGVSELSGSIIGLQRSYNDALHVLLAAGRMTGFQMFYATGVSENESENWTAGPASIWGTSAPEAKIGPLPPGELRSIVDERMHLLKSISYNADLPIHAFTGEWPSGEALVRAEAPLINKSKVRQARFGHAWSSLMHKVTMLRNAFGGDGFDTDVLIEANWEPAELRDDRYRIEVVSMRRPFTSERQALRELGYTTEEIERILSEREMERASGEPEVVPAQMGTPRQEG